MIPTVSDFQDMPITPVILFSAKIRSSSSGAMYHEGLINEAMPKIGLDPLFKYQSVEETRDASSMSEREGEEDRNPKDKEAVVMVQSKDKSVKRRLSLEDGEEDPNKKRKKKGRSRKLQEQNGKPKESAFDKRKLEKPRKIELEHLHADSQRLLRETRDASFRAVLHNKRPISSVLEKIQLRKLDLLKSWMPSVTEMGGANMSGCNVDPVNHNTGVKDTDDGAKADDVLSNGGNDLLNALEGSPSSYQPASNIKSGFHGAGGFNVSSSEEESDKENIGPCNFKSVEMDLSPKNGLAKTFLDYEAEEDCDSDGDLLRSQESEEENVSEHELADLIATDNVEAPMDQEKHNELHQKWLEQQDAAETENVLQRLKCHQGRGGSSFIHGDSNCYDGSADDVDRNDNYDDEHTAKCDDEAEYNHHTIHSALQGFKKAKQMVSQMFTDSTDIYVPSDDEENERNFIRHNILKQNEEPSIISPVEDENSREFFGLIKKLNIVPASKKRGKASASLFDYIVVPGNSNSSSKSSFLNRASCSLTSSHKQGISSVKAFIFGRDDSNSRSNISTTDNNSDMDQNGGSGAKTAATEKKISRPSVNRRKVRSDSARSSLFSILRQSSLKLESKDCARNHAITESQAAHKFSAFNLRRI